MRSFSILYRFLKYPLLMYVFYMLSSYFSVVSLAGAEEYLALQPPSSGVRLRALSKTFENGGIGTASGDIDDEYSYITPTSSFVSNAVASASTAIGKRPAANADAEASHSMSPISSANPRVEAEANAGVNYQVRVLPRSAPPIVYQPPIFLSAEMRGEANSSGCGAIARVTISEGGRTFASEIAAAANWSGANQNFYRTAGFSVIPGVAINVAVSAGVQCTTRYWLASDTVSGMAYADPVFTFDQEAFDNWASDNGFESFPLANYYSLEYSEGILPATSGSKSSLMLLLQPVLARKQINILSSREPPTQQNSQLKPMN